MIFPLLSGFSRSGNPDFYHCHVNLLVKSFKWICHLFFFYFPVFPDLPDTEPDFLVNFHTGVILRSSRTQRYPICGPRIKCVQTTMFHQWNAYRYGRCKKENQYVVMKLPRSFKKLLKSLISVQPNLFISLEKVQIKS